MKLRIRIDGIELPQSITALLTSSKEFIIVKHELPNNPHYHAYIDNEMIMSPQSFRYHLRKIYEKSSDYSVKQCEDGREDEYVQYLFNTKKGNQPFLISTNLSDERVSKARLGAEQVRREFDESVRNARPKSLYDIAMYVNKIADTSEHDILVREVIKALHKFCKVHDEFLVNKVVFTIMSFRDVELVLPRVRRST